MRSRTTRSGRRSAHRATPDGPSAATSTRKPSLRSRAATADAMEASSSMTTTVRCCTHRRIRTGCGGVLRGKWRSRAGRDRRYDGRVPTATPVTFVDADLAAVAFNADGPGAGHRAGGGHRRRPHAGVDERGVPPAHAGDGPHLVLEPVPPGVLVQGGDVGRPPVRPRGVLRLRRRHPAAGRGAGGAGRLPHRRAHLLLPALRRRRDRRVDLSRDDFRSPGRRPHRRAGVAGAGVRPGDAGGGLPQAGRRRSRRGPQLPARVGGARRHVGPVLVRGPRPVAHPGGPQRPHRGRRGGAGGRPPRPGRAGRGGGPPLRLPLAGAARPAAPARRRRRLPGLRRGAGGRAPARRRRPTTSATPTPSCRSSATWPPSTTGASGWCSSRTSGSADGLSVDDLDRLYDEAQVRLQAHGRRPRPAPAVHAGDPARPVRPPARGALDRWAGGPTPTRWRWPRSTSWPATSSRWCSPSASTSTSTPTRSTSTGSCARSTPARTCTSCATRRSPWSARRPSPWCSCATAWSSPGPSPAPASRGATPEEDRRLGGELREHPKEVAEHIMLVDLARNDVGRVVTLRHREGRRADDAGALQPRDAPHVAGVGRAGAGQGPDRRAAGHPARGHGVGRAQGAGHGDHRRPRADQAGPLRRRGRLPRLLRQPRHRHLHPHDVRGRRRPGVGAGRRGHRGRQRPRGRGRRVPQQGGRPAGGRPRRPPDAGLETGGRRCRACADLSTDVRRLPAVGGASSCPATSSGWRGPTP